MTGGQTITVNGQAHPCREQTVAALMSESGIPADRRGVAVAVNGTVVPRARWDDTRLASGDVVEIVQPLQGGCNATPLFLSMGR